MMHNSSLLVWPSTADVLREVLHVPEGKMTCCGTTRQEKSCTRRISQASRTSIQQLLSDAVAAGSWSAAQQLLARLAQLVLCLGRHSHQDQGSKLLCSWRKSLVEAEKPHAVGEAVAKLACASANNAAIKRELIDIRTNASSAGRREVTIKSEPDDEDSDLTSLSEVQEEAKPAHTFVPYGKPRTQEQINKAIKGIIGKPLSPTDKESLSVSGVVYTYKLVKDAGDQKKHLKIGFTKHLARRAKEWERSCGYSTRQMSHNTTTLYRRVEGLVHAQLWACRRREERCPGCGRSHKEFFDVRLGEASGVIGLWTEWMEHMPYGEDGLLKMEWQQKLRQVDLSDPNCWEAFTAKV